MTDSSALVSAGGVQLGDASTAAAVLQLLGAAAQPGGAVTIATPLQVRLPLCSGVPEVIDLLSRVQRCRSSLHRRSSLAAPGPSPRRCRWSLRPQHLGFSKAIDLDNTKELRSSPAAPQSFATLLQVDAPQCCSGLHSSRHAGVATQGSAAPNDCDAAAGGSAQLSHVSHYP